MIVVKSLPTITMSGSAQQITTTSIKVVAVIFQAPSANGANVVAECNSALSTANGAAVAPGKEVSFGAPPLNGGSDEMDLSSFYVKGTASDTIRISYIQRI